MSGNPLRGQLGVSQLRIDEQPQLIRHGAGCPRELLVQACEDGERLSKIYPCQMPPELLENRAELCGIADELGVRYLIEYTCGAPGQCHVIERRQLMRRAREICSRLDVTELGHTAIELRNRKLGGAMIPTRHERKYFFVQLHKAPHVCPIVRMRWRQTRNADCFDVLFGFGRTDGKGGEGLSQLRAAGNRLTGSRGIQPGFGELHRSFQECGPSLDERVEVFE